MTAAPQTITLYNPNVPRLPRHILACADRNLPFIEPNTHQGQTAVIAAPGPTLTKFTTLERIRKETRKGAVLFGIKEGIRLLKERKLPVRYSVQMDPGAEQIRKLPVYDGITYFVASSCHPDVFEFLEDHRADIRVYHSACGAVVPWQGHFLGEVQVYETFWPGWDGWVASGGYDVTSRAVAVARYLGFARIVVVGAQWGFRAGSAYYAPGVKCTAGNEGIDLTDEGKVDGTPWMTRPDLLASAVDMARLVKAGVVEVVGDSLARSLARHDDAFLDRCLGAGPSAGP